MHKKKFYFIVFEGVEGTGKSYQINKLYKNLKNKKRIDKIKIEQLNTYGNKILKNTVNELNYIIKK